MLLLVANYGFLYFIFYVTIGELAGMVGHDLRNPLAGIRNAVYYVKKMWRLPEPAGPCYARDY